MKTASTKSGGLPVSGRAATNLGPLTEGGQPLHNRGGRAAGDAFRSFGNDFFFGIPGRIERGLGPTTPEELARSEDSDAARVGGDVGTAASVFVPIPGGHIPKLLKKLGISLSSGNGKVALVSGGTNAALNLFNELRGANPVTRRGPGFIPPHLQPVMVRLHFVFHLPLNLACGPLTLMDFREA